MDDFGTRNPDKKIGKRAQHGYDWFAVGGVLVKEEDEPEARRRHKDFCERWDITYPLHSSEIRGRSLNFLWLEDASEEVRKRFLEELYCFMRDCPVLGLACVIDRPGYAKRYAERYGDKRWLLCKTAFTVAVERAAKYARSMGYKLRVMPERCNKPDDRRLKEYYEALRSEGMPFATDTSGKYAPLTATELSETLHEFRTKNFTSPMAQLADLFLWPMCLGGYHESNRPYARLNADGKLIESQIPPDEWPVRGSKYSCFDLVARKP